MFQLIYCISKIAQDFGSSLVGLLSVIFFFVRSLCVCACICKHFIYPKTSVVKSFTIFNFAISWQRKEGTDVLERTRLCSFLGFSLHLQGVLAFSCNKILMSGNKRKFSVRAPLSRIIQKRHSLLSQPACKRVESVSRQHAHCMRQHTREEHQLQDQAGIVSVESAAGQPVPLGNSLSLPEPITVICKSADSCSFCVTCRGCEDHVREGVPRTPSVVEREEPRGAAGFQSECRPSGFPALHPRQVINISRFASSPFYLAFFLLQIFFDSLLCIKHCFRYCNCSRELCRQRLCFVPSLRQQSAEVTSAVWKLPARVGICVHRIRLLQPLFSHL